MSEIRIPTQKRSIEKKDKIIEKGFELICNNGFYHVTTKDIAKYANVSTGIIYQYFNDKKEIFIEGIKNYSNNIMYPMLNIFEKTKITKNNLETILNNIIDKYIKSHTISKKAHEELLAMSHLDDDIANIFKENEFEMTKKIVTYLENNNIKVNNAFEKIHIIYNIIDSYCHEVVYHKHKELNYELMKKEIIKVTLNLLK